MSVGRAAGHPDYSSSNSSNYIPEIWAGKLIEKFYKTTVFGAISNTNYQGVIKNQGDKVYIRQIGDVTISDYVKGQKLVYERIESTDVELAIDKAKYFAFTCDDVDAYQSDIKLMNEWSTDASEQMKIKIDSLVLQDMATSSSLNAYNVGATAGKISGSFNIGASAAPVQLTKANVLEYIVDCGTVLDEQNVPETGRWMVIPSWVANLIKKSDLKDASLVGESPTIMRNGRLGIIDRFTLYLSNNVYSATDTVTCYYVLFGTNHAITFASQITKMESLRAETTFGDLVRGLQVYGYQLVKPEAMGMLYCRK